MLRPRSWAFLCIIQILGAWVATAFAASNPGIIVSAGSVVNLGEILQVSIVLRNDGGSDAINLQVTSVSPIAPLAYRGPALPHDRGDLVPKDLSEVPLQFNIAGIAPGTVVLFTITGRFLDAAGKLYSYGSNQPVQIPPMDTGEPLRQAVWRDFKDAIRRGDTAAALALTSLEGRARIEAFLSALTPRHWTAIDAILPDIRLLKISPAGHLAIYEATRLTAGVLNSYEVRFLRESDGLWRILGF